jgi:hypothetical protein
MPACPTSRHTLPAPGTIIIVVGHRYRQRRLSTRATVAVAWSLALLAGSALARSRLPSLAQLANSSIAAQQRHSCLLPILYYLPSFLLERRRLPDYSTGALMLQVLERLVKQVSVASPVLAPSSPLAAAPWPQS